MWLDDTAGQFELDILVGLLGAFVVSGELQKAGCETVTPATQFCKVG